MAILEKGRVQVFVCLFPSLDVTVDVAGHRAGRRLHYRVLLPIDGLGR